MARVCVDSNYFDVDASGNLTLKPQNIGLRQLNVTAAPGTSTFTKASFPGLVRVRVRVIGGGGGGGGAAAVTGASTSAGGGGGGYSESVIAASSLGASETITVGAGGAGGVGGVAGTAGGQSSFGGFVVANGGNGSPAAVDNRTTGFNNATFAYGGYGAAAGTGQIAVPGGNSTTGTVINDFVSAPGRGGNSGGGYGAGGQPGGNGSGYGGGGGGTNRNDGFPATNGGNGAPGAVLIELYF